MSLSSSFEQLDLAIQAPTRARRHHPMEVFAPITIVDKSEPEPAPCGEMVTVNSRARHIEKCAKCMHIILPSTDPANAV